MKPVASGSGNPTIRGVEMLPDGIPILPRGLRIGIALMAILLVGWISLFQAGGWSIGRKTPMAKVVAELPISSSQLLEQALSPGRWGHGWRTFAAPLAVGTDALILFQRDGDKAVGWRIDWVKKVEQELDLSALPLTKERYVAVAGKEGIWLVGPHLALIRPDGEMVVRQAFGANEPAVVALRGGGVLAIFPGKGNDAPRLSRITLGPIGELRAEDKGPLPRNRRFGYAAATLADGRVMVAGGDGAATAVDLYDPDTGQWGAAAALPGGRVDATLLALPDGRAVIAGSGWSAATGAHQVAVWEPQTDRWQALPDLPLSLRISSHGARAPSGAVLPDGSLVFGGGMNNALQLLRSEGKTWASVWRVVGETTFDRVGGVVQALGNQNVVVAGGVFAESGAGGCCSARAGVDRISWTGAGTPSPQSFGLSRRDPVIAQRGSEVFVTGGWQGFHMSFGTLQFSALVELVDLARGTVRQLAPLPAAIGYGQALWLDGERVLVKGVGMTKGASAYRGIDSRSVELGEGGGVLALYDRRQDAWRWLIDPRIHGASLAGIDGGDAFLFDVGGQVWAVALSNFAIRELPRLTLARSDGTSRVLAGGRIVVAGGQAQAKVVSVIDPDCEGADCPDRYVGFGEKAPANRHEIYDPTTRKWNLSEASALTPFDTVILNDGRVVLAGILSRIGDGKSTASGEFRLAIERSSVDGLTWSELPLPTGIAAPSDSGDAAACTRDQGRNSCRLLLGNAPSGGGDLLFFKQVDQADRYWRWDESRSGWLPLEGAPSGSPLKSMALSSGSASRWRIGGFDLGQAMVWAE